MQLINSEHVLIYAGIYKIRYPQIYEISEVRIFGASPESNRSTKRSISRRHQPTMALARCLTPLFCHQKQLTPPKIPLHKPFTNPITISARRFRYSTTTRFSVNENPENLAAVLHSDKSKWEEWLAAAASLYPVYVTAGGVAAFVRPSTFSWFVNMAPNSYSLTLGLIMLSMGITLEFKELIDLFRQRPLSVSSATFDI